MHRGMQGAQRCIQECVEVHGGTQGCTKVGKGTQWCSEMHGGMHKFAEGCTEVC